MRDNFAPSGDIVPHWQKSQTVRYSKRPQLNLYRDIQPEGWRQSVANVCRQIETGTVRYKINKFSELSKCLQVEVAVAQLSGLRKCAVIQWSSSVPKFRINDMMIVSAM